MGGLKDHVVNDIHIGAGGAIETAFAEFEARPQYSWGAVNAETNAGTHDLLRALDEAADLNDWFSCAEPNCQRLKFRTASFCNERSGHYDNFDQGITFFLPNMTWIQPPGYVHQIINQTFMGSAVNVQAQLPTEASVSAQVSADGKEGVLRFTNRASVPITMNIDFVQGKPAATVKQTILRAGLNGETANAPSNPTAVLPDTTQVSIVWDE